MFSSAQKGLRVRWARIPWLRFGGAALDSFFVSGPAGLVVLDANLRVVRANQTIAEMIGVPPETVVGQEPRSLVPQLAPTVEPLLRGVLSSGVPALNFPVSGETPKKPGVTRHWIASVFPVNESWPSVKGVGAVVVEVTDSVQFERVNRSETLLAEAESLARVGSWEVDAFTGEGRWSANLCRMWGLDPSPGRFAESKFWELIHPGDREKVRAVTEQAMKDAKPYEYQARFLLHNASEKVFLTRGNPMRDAANRVVKCVGVTQDVTDRIVAERALKESEERYRDLVESSHDLICLHDLDGRLLWMNALPAQLLGYSPDKLIGRKIPEMLEPEIRDQFGDYIKRICRDGHAEGLMRVVARSGERRVWQYQNTLRIDGPGALVVRGMAHDITDLKRAEKSLRLFRKLIDESNDAFEVIDADTLRLLDVNERECRELGYTREELLRLTIFDIDPTLSRADFPKASEEVRKLGSLRIEGVHRRKDGSTFPVELSIKFVPLDRGYFVTVARDITERKQATRVIQEQADQLRGLAAHLMMAQDDERRRIAQELHEGTAQDLTSIEMELGSLRCLDNPSLASRALGVVDQSLDTVSRARERVRTLSDELHPVHLELAGLWNTLAAYAVNFGRNSGIHVRIEMPERIERLPHTHEIAVFRIVQECLANVRRHPGSKEASIHIQNEDCRIVLEVSGSGNGNLPDSEDYLRCGFGIAEMRERAAQIGGTVEIDSSPGPGITVRVSIPRLSFDTSENTRVRIL